MPGDEDFEFDRPFGDLNDCPDVTDGFDLASAREGGRVSEANFEVPV